ncbi:MAG: putative bifunctional diguanylate cyclase/phosphodiesterase [Solirubrobacterales bacterium]
MGTLTEIIRWIVYRLSAVYYRVAGVLLGRDRLVLGSERRFRGLLESAPDAMVIVNSHGHIEFVNTQTERLFGYDRREILRQNIGELFPDRLRAQHRQHLKGYMRDAKTQPMGIGEELFGCRKDGTEFPIEISLSPLEAEGGLLVSTVIRDITERKRAEAELRHLADHDGLTGLLNRRRFEERLEQAVAEAHRYELDGTMLLVDIDGLKDVNDTLGHMQGDELIRSIGASIATRVRETDIVARIGGDEFAVLMPNTDAAGAQVAATALLAAIRDAGIALGSQRLRPSVCVGIAGFDEGYDMAADVMVAADLALYRAKEGGRDRVGVYTPDLGGEGIAVERTPWVRRIRRSLDEDLFVPYRQPIMSLPSREISNYELLARMLDDESSQPVLPGGFLPAAERSGMVRELDRKMASWAIELIAHSERAGRPLNYEVNLSALTLADREFPGWIAGLVEDEGIDPTRLMFEITETAAIANLQDARAFAEVLRRLGCRFALDDFGAGFASFSYLKHIPLDALKIDGEFIRNVRTNPTDQVLVKHMSEIATQLGLFTIAEFVEDEKTLEMLANYGVDAVQGFHIGKPEPALEISTLTIPKDLGAPPPQPSGDHERRGRPAAERGS